MTSSIITPAQTNTVINVLNENQTINPGETLYLKITPPPHYQTPLQLNYQLIKSDNQIVIEDADTINNNNNSYFIKTFYLFPNAEAGTYTLKTTVKRANNNLGLSGEQVENQVTITNKPINYHNLTILNKNPQFSHPHLFFALCITTIILSGLLFKKFYKFF